MMGFRVAVFLALSHPWAAAAGDGGAEVPLPAPGFDVDRIRTDLDRPVRPRGKRYKGPIFDVHVHLDPPRPDHPVADNDLGRILEITAEAGVERLIVMPTPNEGRSPNHRKGAELKRRLVALGGSRIGLFCGGGYLTAWIDRAYRDGYTADDLERRLARLDRELGGRECLGTGEIGPYHFNKKGRQAVVDFPMNFGPFLRTVAVTAASGKWFDLHAEAVEPGGRSREDDVFGGIALMMERNPGLKLILSHTAMTNPANARRLLETYPGLMMNFKIVRHHDGWRNLEPVTDRKGNIYEDWAALFEAFSDRFMVGSDAKFGRPGFDADKYRKEVRRLRRLLGVLDPEAAERIAYLNARRIFGR